MQEAMLGSEMRNTGMALWRQQFYAMLVKHCLHSIRNKYVSRGAKKEGGWKKRKEYMLNC